MTKGFTSTPRGKTLRATAGWIRRHRARVFGCLILAAFAAFLAWTYARLRPGTWRVYTDELEVRRLARDVEPRWVVWEQATPLQADFNAPSDPSRFAVSPDGATLVFSRGIQNGNGDLFLSRWNGARWGAPEPLRALNSPFNETAPLFSPDGKFLYFSTDRPGGAGGWDIWVARWDGTTFAWPLPLTEEVNSRYDETSPALSPDGNLLYFSSDRPRDGVQPDPGVPAAEWVARHPRQDADIFYAERIPAGVTNVEIRRAQSILYSLRERALSDTNTMRKLGGTVQTEAAVDRALAWLASTQATNGSWSITASGGQSEHDVAATAFALLTFYGRSERHDRPGRYRDTVRRGLDWLLAEENRLTGDLRGKKPASNGMYDQCIGTLALAEAYGLTKDESLREAVQSAVFFLVDAQHAVAGGWRYQPNDEPDLSVSGWAILALKSAEFSGIHVQRKTADGIRKWLRACSFGPYGGVFDYMPTSRQYSKAMAATGFFCSELMGLSPNTRQAIEAAQTVGTEASTDDVYFLYYGTLANYQFQGPIWRDWRNRMQQSLLASQRPDGSWAFSGQHGAAMGRPIATALAALSLQAQYRYTPLYGLGYEPSPNAGAGLGAGVNLDDLPEMPNFESAKRFYNAINTTADDTGPMVSPHGDFLYFASNRRGGFGGFDLYRTRISGRFATEPENLGQAINTRADERNPSLRNAGFTLLFSSGCDARSNRVLSATSRQVWARHEYSRIPPLPWIVERHGWRILAALVSFSSVLAWMLMGALRRRSKRKQV